MTSIGAERQAAADRLIEGLERDRFVLYSQEIKPLRGSREMPYREILVRFLDREETLLPAGDFIPVLESCGLMYTLDRWVITRVLSWLHRGAGMDGNGYPARCSINLSADTLRNYDFPVFLAEQLKLFRVAPGAISFELTELDAKAHTVDVDNAIKRLKKIGCGVSLSGYKGAQVTGKALRRLAVDAVKIDGSIIRLIHASAGHLKAVEIINRMCHAHGMSTVGELVERAETLEILRRTGVDYAQGFAVGKPEQLA